MPFFGLISGAVAMGGSFSVASAATLLLGVASEDSVASRRPLGLVLSMEGFLSSAKYLCGSKSASRVQLAYCMSRAGG